MEAQVAWRELNSAFDAALAGPASSSCEIQSELAGLRAALRDAVVKRDFETQPRQGYHVLLTQIVGDAPRIGPDGPMGAPEVRVGLTLMAPHTVYPMHDTPARYV